MMTICQKFVFFLWIVLQPFIMSGQKDSIFVVYPSDDYSISTIKTVKLFRDGAIGLIHYGDRSTLIVVDGAGNILRRKRLNEIDGYSIHSCMEWIEADTHYVAIINISHGSTYYLATIGLNKQLDKCYWIDTVRIPYQRNFVNLRRIHFNEIGRQFEGFGVVASDPDFRFGAQCYFSLRSDFTFERVYFFNAFPPSGSGDFVMDFRWVEASGRYFVSLFGGRALLLDKDLNTLLRWTPRFRYQGPDGMWNEGGGNIPDCVSESGNLLTCLTRSPFNGPSDISVVRYAIEPDTIRALQAFPLNAPSLEMNVWPHFRRDHVGNYVLAGTNGLFPITTKYKMKIAKFSSTLEKMWETQFEAGNRNFEVWDMAIDDNNDIILVGRAWDIYDLAPHGFMLKVYADGRLTTSVGRPDVDKRRYEVVLMPNPTTATLCLQAPAEDLHWLRLWSADGRLVLSESVTAPHCFDLPAALPAGVYAVEVLFADGYRAVRKVVVVR